MPKLDKNYTVTEDFKWNMICCCVVVLKIVTLLGLDVV